MKNMTKTAALAIAGAALALGVGACTDAEAVAKAEAAAKAKKEEAAKTEKLKGRVTHNVDCLSALRWQKAALTGAGIGSLDLYQAHYQERLEDAVGSAMVPGENGAPMLSRASMEDYLNWAYADTVKTKFTAGKDENKDGTVSASERNARGYNMVSACVLEVAEAGKGPLAGPDKIQRMLKIDALRAKLKDKGA